jgi:hypothetical protein
MTLKAGDKFTWTDPDNKEVYHFVADEVEEFGNIYTITVKNGTTFDAFGQEINCPESVDILDEQVNPEDDDDEPVRYGAMR